MSLTPDEFEQLRKAKALLENPSLAARLTDVIGKPLEKAMNLLPQRAAETVHLAVNKALERALSELPERYRSILRPYLEDGQPPREIAAAKGIAPGTVRPT